MLEFKGLKIEAQPTAPTTVSFTTTLTGHNLFKHVNNMAQRGAAQLAASGPSSYLSSLLSGPCRQFWLHSIGPFVHNFVDSQMWLFLKIDHCFSAQGSSQVSWLVEQ